VTSLAQVGPPDKVVLREARGGVLKREAARLKHISSLGHLQSKGRVLFHEEDRSALFVYSPEGLEDIPDEKWGEAKGRLIEEEQPRVGHQSPADGEHLLLAAAQSSSGLAFPSG